MERFIAIIYILFLFATSSAQFTVDTSKDVRYVLKTFLTNKANIKVDDVEYTGNKYSLGLFQNRCHGFPIFKGIVISSGDIWDAVGPNTKGNSGNNHYQKGDPELGKLAYGKTYDAAILEFNFRANSDSISFDFIFASEEYPEYVNKGLNDVFAFFISDTSGNNVYNIALCNDKPITVNNINSGSNSNYFISNDRFVMGSSECLSYSVQFDGLTVKLSTGMKIIPYKPYHFKICIADVGDGLFDSAVFLRAHSFASSGKTDIPVISELIKTEFEDETVFFDSDTANIVFIPNITFDFDSHSIQDSSISILTNLISLLKCYYDFNIEITGFSDNIGSDDYNKNLSLKRAETIAGFFTEHEIEPGRLQTFGLGNTNPVANNNMVTGRAKNRRVVIRMFK